MRRRVTGHCLVRVLLENVFRKCFPSFLPDNKLGLQLNRNLEHDTNDSTSEVQGSVIRVRWLRLWLLLRRHRDVVHSNNAGDVVVCERLEEYDLWSLVLVVYGSATVSVLSVQSLLRQSLQLGQVLLANPRIRRHWVHRWSLWIPGDSHRRLKLSALGSTISLPLIYH